MALEPTRKLTQYDERAWGVRDGLPQTNVQALAQTPDGYLWVGTDGGLARFDGRTFTIFDASNTPPFRIPRVRALLADRHGDLWIATDGGAGLVRYRQGRFEAFESRTGLRGRANLSLLETRDGDMWFGAYWGVLRLQAGKFEKYEVLDGIGVGPVYALAEADDGAVWLAGTNGVIRYANGRARSVTAPNRGAVTHVRSMLSDLRGGMWLASSALGLLHSDGRTITMAGSSPAEGRPSLAALRRDRAGTLWVAGERGVGRLAPSHGSSDVRIEWAPPGTPLSERATSITEDKEGNLWVGRQVAGLLRLSEDTFTSLPPERFDGRRTIATFVAKDGALWLASADVGVTRVTGDDDFHTYRPIANRPTTLCTANVWAMAEEPGGGIWFGGAFDQGGNLCRRDPVTGHFRTYGAAEGLPRADIRSLAVLPDGQVLIGTGLGLFRKEGERFREVRFSGGQQTGGVMAIHRDRKGTLWLGATGVVRWQPGDASFHRYEYTHGLSNNQVFSVDEDAHGALWLGTLSGFSRLKDGRITAWKHRQGFLDDPVFKVLPDAQNNLWLCSTKGVFRVTADAIAAFDADPERPLAYTHYDSADGLKADQCEGGLGQNAAARASSGRLWFGTARGVAFVDPDRLPRTRPAPPAIIESVAFDGKTQAIHPSSAQEVNIPPGRRDLQFTYTALWLARPEKLRFRHRLDPFDTDWVETGDRRVAYYTHVPPGRYRFRVMAGTDEVAFAAARPEATLALVLAPHWHQALWARALAGLAATAAVAAGMWLWYQRRLRGIEAQHVAVLAERSRIARDLHDTLAQGFTGISVQLESAMNRLPEGAARVRENLNMARALVQASLADARRAVWDLRPIAAEQSDLVGALSEMARNLSADVPVRVQLNGTPRPLRATFETTLIRIGQEALTNALRHARAQNIALEISFLDGGVHLRISDDGTGFDPAQPSTEPGHAGLEGIHERARLIGAEVEVRSQPGIGTELLVNAPLVDSERSDGRPRGQGRP